MKLGVNGSRSNPMAAFGTQNASYVYITCNVILWNYTKWRKKIKWGREGDVAHKQLQKQTNSLFTSAGCNWGSNRELSKFGWLKTHAPSTDPSPGSSNTNRSSVKDIIFNKTSFTHDPSNAQIWKPTTWVCEMSLGWPFHATPSTIKSEIVVTMF